MERNSTHKEEKLIRDMIESSKTKASENLKHRIMRQIETEKLFTAKQAPTQTSPKNESGNVLKDLGSIFGVMYGVIIIMILCAFLMNGESFLLSSHFFWTIIFVTFIFSLLWLISRIDTYIQDKKFRRK